MVYIGMADILKDFDPNGVGVDNGNYYGLPCTAEESDLVLISVPWDVTVSYGKGTAAAPDALIGASTQLDLYDQSAPSEWRRGIATLPVDYSLAEQSEQLRREAEWVIQHLEEGGSIEDSAILKRLARINKGCRDMNDNIYRQASEWLLKGKLVGLVGGDHSTPYGLIRAISEHHDKVGILHVDAHCDLRVAYEGFEYSHASIMHNVLRDFPQVEKIVQVGVRDFCDMEWERTQSDPRIEAFDDRRLAVSALKGESWHSQCERIVGSLPQKVYVSFDIDGLSPDLCPHTGTPVPGGLSFREAVYLLEMIVESGRRIVGFDMVEVTPAEDDRTDEIVGARILYKLCGLALKSNK